MTELERWYRGLMLAYPPDHRAEHEEEIISTLLDVATDGQHRPRLREAAAIITSGLGCRVQDSSELEPGLRLAGIVALAGTFALATMAIVLAAQAPMSVGLIPVLSWLVLLAASVFGACVNATYRMFPAVIVALLMVAAGASSMGLRRSTLVPAAVLLILSVSSRSAGRSARLAAPAVGIAIGSVLGAITAADLEQVFQNSDSPWVYVARWDSASDLVPVNSSLLFVMCLGAAVAAVLGRRFRYAVSASILALPFAPVMLFGQGGLLTGTPPTLGIVNFLRITVVALTLGTAMTLAWLSRRGLPHAGGSI